MNKNRSMLAIASTTTGLTAFGIASGMAPWATITLAAFSSLEWVAYAVTKKRA